MPIEAEKKKPGRPKGQKDARESLLKTASALFAERGADAVSVREIAHEAGVSPAMVNYYFADKQGLMRAVLERGLDGLLAVIEGMGEVKGQSFTRQFIDGYLSALFEDPSLPHLMVREVLSGNETYREVIRERFTNKALALVPSRIGNDVQNRYLRNDLDPRLMMLSLLGMCIFPFLSKPLVGARLGLQFDDAFKEQLIEHTTRLFEEGASPK